MFGNNFASKLETVIEQRSSVLKLNVWLTPPTQTSSICGLYNNTSVIITQAFRGLKHKHTACCYVAFPETELMLLFLLGRQSHITMCFILFIYFILFLFGHFLSSIVVTSASVQAWVSSCVRMRGQLFSQYVHIICFFMGMKVGSSPDVVCPCCSQWLHLYSIINRFREDHIYNRNSPNTLLFSFLFFFVFVILLSSVETLSLSMLTWWLFTVKENPLCC